MAAAGKRRTGRYFCNSYDFVFHSTFSGNESSDWNTQIQDDERTGGAAEYCDQWGNSKCPRRMPGIQYVPTGLWSISVVTWTSIVIVRYN